MGRARQREGLQLKRDGESETKGGIAAKEKWRQRDRGRDSS